MLKRLSALSPFGPIFGKELRTTARRKRTYFLRFGYLALLLLVMCWTYFDANPDRYGGYEGGIAHRAERAARMGFAFFASFTGFCMIAMTLIPPVLTATAISAERAGKTLNVLLMTPITSWQIISGKLLSRLLAAFTLIGLSLPVLAVVRLLGGVDLDRMVWVVILCVITSLFTAAIGLFYSTFLNRAYAVILLSYVTILFLYLFVPMILVLVAEPRRANSGFYYFLAAINPLITAISGIAQGRGPFRGISPIPTIIVHLVATGLLVVWSGAVLRRLARKQGESGGGGAAVDAAVAVDAPAQSVQHFSALPLAERLDAPENTESFTHPLQYRRPQPEGRTVSDNPVLWREIRRPLTNRRWQAVTFTVASLVLLLISYIALASGYRNELTRPDAQIGYSMVFCGLLSMLACVISATAIAGEKEADTWTLLLATPISARQIVLGKLAGQFRRMLYPTVLCVVHLTLFVLTGVLAIESYLIILWVMLTFNVIWVATGLYFSLRFKRVTMAVMLNLLMPVAAFLLMEVVLLILGNLAGERDHWGEWVGWYAPYPYFVSAIEGFSRRGSFWLPNHRYGTVAASEFISAALVVGGLYLAATAVLIRYIVTRFDRIVGRATQRAPLPPETVSTKWLRLDAGR